MKVQFNCDSGANICSNKKSGWLDPVDDLGLDEGEWQEMSDDDKWHAAKDWAEQYLEIDYEEKE